MLAARTQSLNGLDIPGVGSDLPRKRTLEFLLANDQLLMFVLVLLGVSASDCKSARHSLPSDGVR